MEDRYKELFNDPNLGNEDWLEPGPDLLGSIKAELYPVEKDRKYLIILFLLGVITILAIALVMSKQANNSIGELSDSKIESSLTSDYSRKNSFNNKKQKTGFTERENQDLTNQDFSNNIKVDINKDLNKKPKLDTHAKTVRTKKTFQKENNIQFSVETPVLSSSKVRLNIKSFSTNEKIVIENNLLQNSFKKEEPISLLIDLLPNLNRIESKELYYTLDKKELSFTTSSAEDFIDTKKQTRKAWGVNLNAGYFTTKFILNSNYLAALNPADFNQEPGTGQFIDLRIYKELNNRLSVNIGSNFGRTVFNSGHNSIVTYTLIDEAGEQSNNFDMPMATPLGFISSEIAISRAADNVEEETELIVDLQNKHTLNIVDLTVGVNYKLIDRKNINFNVSSAYGFTYLFNIKNEFRSFTPSDAGFNSGKSRITSDQENINNLTPVLDLGLDLNYEIRSGARVGLSYKFKTNLKPIFELNDFNSTMNRNHYGINFQLDLN